VQSEDYLLACYKYAELNPVDARICATPGAYEWSSYCVNGEGLLDRMITPHEEYARPRRMEIPVSAKLGRRAYRALPGRPSLAQSDRERGDLFGVDENVVCP